MPASIFKGSKVKTLKQNLTLNDVVDIQSGTTVPTSSAVDAPQGSLFLNSSNGLTYRKLDSGSSTNWSVLGSGGASGVNYITNSDAEANTTGWVTYASSATPTTLTGGVATATWTRSTTSPLRGLASFLYTTGAVGNGVAFTITPDSADIKAGAVQVVSMDYSVSGTISEGDYQIWIEDIFNAVMIQPAGYKIPSAVSGGAYKLQPVTFQLPTNGTTFRVAIHQAVASPGGNLKVDSISVGPQTRSYGPPVTDWVSYTPTFGMTNQTTTGKWRRVGDQMEVQFYVDFSSSSSGTPSISIPSGYTIDSSKLTDTGTRNIGTAAMNETGQFELVVRYGSSTTGTLIALGSSGTYVNEPGLVTGTVPVTIASTSYITGQMSVPITGWSSTLELSSSTDTRIVAFQATSSTTVIAASSTDTTVINPTVSYDTHGAYATGTGIYTAPVAGKYRFSAGVQGAGLAYVATANLNLGLAKNGTSITKMIHTDVVDAAVTKRMYLFGSTTIDLVAGDTVRLVCSQNNASTSTLNGGTVNNYFEGERISGPSVIAASETVNASYTKSASQSMTNSAFTLIDFATKVDDSHGSVTTGASWKFSAPTSGMYEISGMVFLAAGGAWGVGDRAIIAIYKNGVEFSRPFYYDSVVAHTQAVPCQITTKQIRLLAGDYIDYRLFQDSGGAINIGSDALINWVSIKRVGN
mgnify:CR=1 FL=1